MVGAVQEDFPDKKTIALVMNVIIESENPEIKISNEHVDWICATIDEIKNLDVSGWFKRLLEEKNYIL